MNLMRSILMSVAVEHTSHHISTNMANYETTFSKNLQNKNKEGGYAVTIMNLFPLKNLHVTHLQNKEKGGLGVLREHGGHNEDEDQGNEDPGVNSDNEEEDEFKVGIEQTPLYSSNAVLCNQRLNLIHHIIHPPTHHLFSPV